MNLLLNFLLWMTLFQLANGEILVTLVNENGSPIAQESISFLTEEQQVLASCVTSSQGRCTITLQNAPTDASGFIRGSLSINDRGQRPVLWPGGQIQIQLVLEDGKLSVPSDAYVTRTPKPDATPTVQEQATPSPTAEQATPTVQEQATPSATAEQATPSATAEQASVSSSFLFQAFLFLVMAIALAFYIIKSNKKS